MSVLTTRQHCESYRRTDFLLYRSIFDLRLLSEASRWNRVRRGHLELFPALLFCLFGHSHGWVLWGWSLCISLEFWCVDVKSDLFEPVSFRLHVGMVCSSARSSAQSRSYSWEDEVHWMLLGLPAVVLVAIQSVASRKRVEELMHPCLSPDCIRNHSVRVFPIMTLHSNLS